jgi:hypothetical protein
MTENIQTSDISCVACLGETVLLFVLNKDVETPSCKALQYDLAMKTFSIDENIENFLKFTPFEGTDPSNQLMQDYYRNLVYRKLPTKVFIDALVAFTPDEEKEALSKAIDEDIEKFLAKENN